MNNNHFVVSDTTFSFESNFVLEKLELVIDEDRIANTCTLEMTIKLMQHCRDDFSIGACSVLLTSKL